RETVFKGETLRGLLRTSYGFSEFGVKASQGATVAHLAAGLLVLLSAAGFVHGWRTPKTLASAAPEREQRLRQAKPRAREYPGPRAGVARGSESRTPRVRSRTGAARECRSQHRSRRRAATPISSALDGLLHPSPAGLKARRG